MGGDGDLVHYQKRRGRRAHREVPCGGEVDFGWRKNVTRSGQTGRVKKMMMEKNRKQGGQCACTENWYNDP
jgi:hypothetical protein